MFDSDVLEWFLWPWSHFFSQSYWDVIVHTHLSESLTTDQYRDTRLETRAHCNHELWTLSKLTSEGKGIYPKEVLIQTNTVVLEELGRLITMLCAACTSWVMQYGYSLAGFSFSAQPGASTDSKVHPELLVTATEAQPEILQLPCQWKLQNLAFGCARCITRGKHIGRLSAVLNFKLFI